MVLTVASSVACVVIDDYRRILYGMGERTGFEGLYYFVVAWMALFSLAVEANLWFDISYYVSEKSKKRKYKNIFHIVGTSLVGAIVLGVAFLLIAYSNVVSVATGTLAVALGVTRIAHFVVFVVRYDDDKKDNNISKEIDTQ